MTRDESDLFDYQSNDESGNNRNEIWRRYSEFETLKNFLCAVYPHIVVPPLPEKAVRLGCISTCCPSGHVWPTVCIVLGGRGWRERDEYCDSRMASIINCQGGAALP